MTKGEKFLEKNSRKISDIYFDLFDIMMTYNHKLWRTAALPLPLNHFAVMYYLFEKEDTFATVTELAKHLSISKQQMSPIIDKLVKKEFIKKTCLSKDRRYSQISSRKMDFINNDKHERFITYSERMFCKRHLLCQ